MSDAVICFLSDSMAFKMISLESDKQAVSANDCLLRDYLMNAMKAYTYARGFPSNLRCPFAMHVNACDKPKDSAGMFGVIGRRLDWHRRGPRFHRRVPLHVARRRPLPGGGRSLFAEGESIKATQLTDLKVYVAEGSGEEWQLNGIVWNTKTAAER
eukprot:scaffold229325_cov30-Prasinocladus_malaysianus.AAC.1